jgi:transposase
MAQIVLGIDVSKRTLDAALIFEGRVFCKQFQNSADGFNRLAAWLESLKINRVHACLEATGIYGEAVALFLHECGHLVSVVNPLRIKGYAGANMQRNKTDRLDAQLIASFCQTQEPDGWQPPSAAVKHLQSRVAESRGFGRNAAGGRKSADKCRSPNQIEHRANNYVDKRRNR